jgi:hypothetical protein
VDSGGEVALTGLGEDLLQKIKDMGVAIYDSSDPEIRNFLIKNNARASTWFNGIVGDAGPHTTTLLLGWNVNDAAGYEEYLHILNGKARGWLGLMEPESIEEEIQVEEQVLSQADDLGMTQAERTDLQNVINDYRQKLWNEYGKVVP